MLPYRSMDGSANLLQILLKLPELQADGICCVFCLIPPPNHVLEGGEGGVGGVWRGGGGGGSGWDTPPPRVSGKKLGKIFFFLPKMAMAPKKTKICGTSSPAKECLRWGLNQLPVNLQRTVLPLTYHTELLTSCIPRFIA